MKAVLKELLSSKKFVTAMIAVIVWLVGRLGLHVDAETLAGAITPLLVFIAGQSVADHGKSEALIYSNRVGLNEAYVDEISSGALKNATAAQ